MSDPDNPRLPNRDADRQQEIILEQGPTAIQISGVAASPHVISSSSISGEVKLSRFEPAFSAVERLASYQT
jgi:hypothetical protein